MSFQIPNWSTAARYVLYAIAVWGLSRFFKRVSKKSEAKVNWTVFETLAVTLGIYFGSQWLVQVLLEIFVTVIGWNSQEIQAHFKDPSVTVQFFFTLLSYGIMAWMVVLFLKVRKMPLSIIGWVAPKLRDIWYALGGFLVYFALYGVLISSLVSQLLPVNTEQKQQIGFNQGTVGPELILIFVSLTILPPLVEELVVRGFIYTGLRSGMKKLYAAIIASLLFGAAHLEWGSGAPLLWTAAIDTFTLSMVLVWLRQKTGSLWPGIGVHFIKNSIAFLVLFIFKVT